MFDYFFSDVFIIDADDNNNNDRYNRLVKGLLSFPKPRVGDVLKVFFSKRGSYFFFEGFVFSIQRKGFVKPDTGFKLFNKLKNVRIVFSFSYFYNLIFSIEYLDHKKTNKVYKAAKANVSFL